MQKEEERELERKQKELNREEAKQALRGMHLRGGRMIPTIVKIGPRIYEVVERELLDGGPTNMGSHTEQTLRIEIKSSLAPVMKESTLCHELLHAFLAAGGYNPDNHEQVVSSMETAFHAFLKDNTDYFGREGV